MKTVVLGLSLKNHCVRLCREAVIFAKKRGVSITLVHAITEDFVTESKELLSNCEVANYVERLKAFIGLYDVPVNEIVIRPGKPHEVLSEVADEYDAEAIIVGSGNKFILNGILGSTAEKITQISSRDLFALNHENKSTYEKIVCAFDFSKNSYGALKSAINLTQGFNSELTVIHVCNCQFDEDHMKRQIDEVITEIANGKFLNYSIKIISGDPTKQIIETVDKEKADLLAIGASEQDFLTHLISGRKVYKIINSLSCNKLIAPNRSLSEDQKSSA